jgi:hydroxyacylglutathione hydrolase
MVSATGASLIAHENAGSRIANVDRGVGAGDVIRVGKTVELECLDTPGHTMSHVCLLSHTDIPALFSGDTLFNAGAGNCHNGGHPEALFTTFETQLARLPGNTLLYPGHDYLLNNLGFTLDREPGNETARALKAQLDGQDPDDAYVTTLDEEKAVNTFFRLDSPGVVEKLAEDFPEIGDAPDRQTVFLKLRELRNHW